MQKKEEENSIEVKTVPPHFDNSPICIASSLKFMYSWRTVKEIKKTSFAR